MTPQELKETWIEAYEKTGIEYLENRHELGNCIKCKITLMQGGYNCEKSCLEGLQDEWCLSRLNPAKESDCLSKKDRERLLEYHARALKYLRTVLPITFELHIGVIQNHLFEIDKQVYDGFNPTKWDYLHHHIKGIHI